MIDVVVTNKSELDNNLYEKYIDVFNSIFPQQVEREYAELANLLQEYARCCTNLVTNDSEISRVGKKVVKTDKLVNKMSSNESYLINMIQNLLDKKDEIKTSELFGQIHRLAEKGLKQSLEREITEEQLESSKEYVDDKVLNASANQNNIHELIEKIVNKLKDIKALDKGEDTKRINNLEITHRHIDEIMSLNYISESLKNHLVNLLNACVSSRISAFSKIEELSLKIVELYQNHQTFNDLSEQDINDYNIAIELLTCFGISSLNNNSYSLGHITSLQMSTTLMNIATKYLKNGEIETEDYNVLDNIKEYDGHISLTPGESELKTKLQGTYLNKRLPKI